MKTDFESHMNEIKHLGNIMTVPELMVESTKYINAIASKIDDEVMEEGSGDHMKLQAILFLERAKKVLVEITTFGMASDAFITACKKEKEAKK